MTICFKSISVTLRTCHEADLWQTSQDFGLNTRNNVVCYYILILNVEH